MGLLNLSMAIFMTEPYLMLLVLSMKLEMVRSWVSSDIFSNLKASGLVSSPLIVNDFILKSGRT